MKPWRLSPSAGGGKKTFGSRRCEQCELKRVGYTRVSRNGVVCKRVEEAGVWWAFLIQSVVCGWAISVWSQYMETWTWARSHAVGACAPCLARASASSLPGMPQRAGVHRPLTVQLSFSSCLIASRVLRANSEFAGFRAVSGERRLVISAYEDSGGAPSGSLNQCSA